MEICSIIKNNFSTVAYPINNDNKNMFCSIGLRL